MTLHHLPYMMALSDAFESCAVEPVTEGKDGKATHIVAASAGGWKTTSFFIDSSGHSTLDLPLNLSFDSKEKLDEFLKSKCLNPAPKNIVRDETSNPESDGSSSVVASLGFEIKSFSVDESKNVVVERVIIEECLVEDTTVQFVLKVTVRASNHQIESMKNGGTDSASPSNLSVVTNLEVVPVLTIKENTSEKDSSPIPDPMTLEMAATPQYMRKAKSVSAKEVRLSPVNLNLCLTYAFTISVNSVDGPTIGNTLISLTIRHSNSHQEKVTISNISMHPGHSRYKTVSDKNKNNKSGAQYSVTNMTQSVQWGYAPKTQLDLPLTLNPHDAYATILTVNASEEIQGRSFISPVSVTGVIGSSSSADGELGGEQKHVVVAADAMWSAGLIAVEPTDAFRIDMKVQSSNVVLGEPMIVFLDIFNLSLEACDLMLLMAKDDDNAVEEATSKHKAVNAAIISEVDGYKFGVWGISGEDDGTVKLIRDNELLAMDAALMLGKVQGQHSVQAQLRFVPLREGRLGVPNWKLYDRAAGTWYTCYHSLTIVAIAKA